MVAGVALFLLGALGVEAVNGWLYERKSDGGSAEYAYLLGTLVEEALETAACTPALVGISGLLVVECSTNRRVLRGAR